MDIAWMAWTWQTAILFVVIFASLATLTVLAVVRPEVPRHGILGLTTTRGDRLFLSLLGSAIITLLWIGLVGPNLWWGLGVSLLYAAAVFRWV